MLKPSNSPPSNGWIGSTTGACSSRSETSRPPRRKPPTMPSLSPSQWPRRTQTNLPPGNPVRFNPALIKAIARGRAWFEELVGGRARSLQELAKRDGISRRYIRRLVGLAFLSPELIEAILQGRQPVALTATRLTELDLPLGSTEQHKLLAG